MSTIKTGTTLTTAYVVEGDTTGDLVIQTGATPTTAVTISDAQVVTFANPPVGAVADGSVTTAKIADSAVTTAKIADANVTAAKLASGAARANFGAGAVLQVVSVAKTDIFSTTSTSFIDVTGLSASITPTSSSNKILVIAGVSLGALAGTNAIFPRLARNGTAIFQSSAAGSRIQAVAMFEVGNAATFPVAINFLDSPASTSSQTYSIQVRVNSGTGRVNASYTDTDTGTWSRSASSITLLEIAG